jgi:hypothetical protein
MDNILHLQYCTQLGENIAARASWCLHKLNHGKGENLLSYSIDCKILYLYDLTMERASQIPNQPSGVQLEQINPRHGRDLFTLKPLHPH